jgi:hypothetical protein
MGIVELKKIGETDSISIPFSKKYMFGSGIYILKELRIEEEAFQFIESDNIGDINTVPDYAKFILDKNLDIYATPTSELFYSHFYLMVDNYSFESFAEEFIENKVISISRPELLTREIFTIIMCLKIFKVPHFVVKLILIELCKLNFKDADDYYCNKCNTLKIDGCCTYCLPCKKCGIKENPETLFARPVCEGLFCRRCYY